MKQLLRNKKETKIKRKKKKPTKMPDYETPKGDSHLLPSYRLGRGSPNPSMREEPPKNRQKLHPRQTRITLFFNQFTLSGLSNG
jgi:hypothetical protein